MSFLTNLLLKKQVTFKALPELIRSTTSITISDAQKLLSEQVTSGSNWLYPDARSTLNSIDLVSNECCRVIDSSLVLYKNYSGEGNKPL